MRNCHIVIPLAGRNDESFAINNVNIHRCLSQWHGATVLENCLDSFKYDVEQLTFICRQDDVVLQEFITKRFPCADLKVRCPSRGALETCYSVTKQMVEKPLLIILPDTKIIGTIDTMDINSTGWLATFRAFDERHSYIKYDKNVVLETREKEVISDIASAGVYYFDSLTMFNHAAKESIDVGKYFICPIYNSLIKTGQLIMHELFEVKKLGTYDEIFGE